MPWASWRPCWELLFFSSSIESLAEERGGADGWDEATVVRGPQLVDGNVVGGFAEVMLVLEEHGKGDGRRDHPRHEDDAAENDEASLARPANRIGGETLPRPWHHPCVPELETQGDRRCRGDLQPNHHIGDNHED